MTEQTENNKIVDDVMEPEQKDGAQVPLQKVPTFKDYLIASLPDLANSESPQTENGKPPHAATQTIFRAQTVRNDAATVNTTQATPILLASGHNLLARYANHSVRLSFLGPSRFSVECSMCKPRGTDVHLFNCVHGWSTLLSAFKLPSTIQTLSYGEAAFLGDWGEEQEQADDAVDIIKLTSTAVSYPSASYEKVTSIFVFPTCMYVMYFDADVRVRSEANEWFVECSCDAYAKSSTCPHTILLMRNLRADTYFQDAKYVCSTLCQSAHDTLVNFALSFSFKSELDLLLEETALGFTRASETKKIEGKEGKEGKEERKEGEDDESVDGPKLAADISVDTDDASLYTMEFEAKEVSSCSIAYVAPNLVTECEGNVTLVTLNETRDKVVEAKCACGFKGLMWCAHISHVVSQCQNSVIDYHQLKAAVAALPHDVLVHELISLFSNNSLEIELGIAEHLGREILAEWVAKARTLDPVKFLSHVDEVLGSYACAYEDKLDIKRAKKVEIWKQKQKNRYYDSSDSDSDDYYGYHNHHHYYGSPDSDDMEDDDVDSEDDPALAKMSDEVVEVSERVSECLSKVSELADAEDYTNAFTLLWGLTSCFTTADPQPDPYELLNPQDLDGVWVRLLQEAPLTPEECMSWAEKLTPFISPFNTSFRNAQAQAMARYSMLLENEESLDQRITEALEDAAGKYKESQFLGFAKGAYNRGMYAATYLLCLKILTVPGAKALSEVGTSTRKEVISLMCNVLVESNKGSAEESVNGVESLFRLSSRTAANFLYCHYKTEDSFQMDLSTLFATLVSVDSLVTASILVEFTVLAAKDFLKQGPEIFSLVDGLLRAKKPRHAFSVGLLAHSRPEPLEQKDVEKLCDMALSANDPKYRDKFVNACLASTSDTMVLHLASKLYDRGDLYLAFLLALKAAKIDQQETVGSQTCTDFITEILPGVGGDELVYEHLSELLYMVDIPLVQMKNKLQELGFQKCTLLATAKLAETNQNYISEMVNLCKNFPDQEFASNLLAQHIASCVTGQQKLVEYARSLLTHGNFRLAWLCVVRAAASASLSGYHRGYTMMRSYNYMGYDPPQHNPAMLDIFDLALSVAAKIPLFDPDNVVALITDFGDPSSIAEFLKRPVALQTYGALTPSKISILFNVCKMEYLNSAHRVATFAHCGHNQCRKCEHHYQNFARVIKEFADYGFVFKNEQSTNSAIAAWKSPHTRKTNMMHAISAKLAQTTPAHMQSLRNLFASANLHFMPSPAVLLKYSPPPASVHSKTEIMANFTNHTDPRRDLVRRLDLLQREIHTHGMKNAPLFMSRPISFVRKEIQTVLDSLEQNYRARTPVVLKDTHYTKYLPEDGSKKSPTNNTNNNSLPNTTIMTTKQVNNNTIKPPNIPQIDLTQDEPKKAATNPPKKTPLAPHTSSQKLTTAINNSQKTSDLQKLSDYLQKQNGTLQLPQLQTIDQIMQKYNNNKPKEAAPPSATTTNAMIINVQFLGKSQKFRVSQNSPVQGIAPFVAQHFKLNGQAIKFNFGGRELHPTSTFADCGIVEDSTIYVTYFR
eukprot:Phypoly_transcript_00316.p1 GENE.Phypoly_transcript_00316~~Phypoly_transcript_00316.p1  ORF type:complete len:1728 (+),score=286.93 Phypoly_transcript_00316:542-5185(+)